MITLKLITPFTVAQRPKPSRAKRRLTSPKLRKIRISKDRKQMANKVNVARAVKLMRTNSQTIKNPKRITPQLLSMPPLSKLMQ